jgi:hypothetical protein
VSEQNKAVVRRLVDDVMNSGRLEVLDELYAPRPAAAARTWIAPFRASFPDVNMRVVDLIAEGDKVVGRFLCSGVGSGGQPVAHAAAGLRPGPTSVTVACSRVGFDRLALIRLRPARAVAVTLRARPKGDLRSLGGPSPDLQAWSSVSEARVRFMSSVSRGRPGRCR